MGQDLVGSDRSRQQADKEIVGLDQPLARGTNEVQLCSERERCRWKVGRRVAVDQASADRATVAYLHIRHLGGRLRQQRYLRLQHVRRLQCVMCREPTNRDRAVVLPNIGQTEQAANVDEVFRLGEAQLHDRDQAVSAGEQLRVVAVLR